MLLLDDDKKNDFLNVLFVRIRKNEANKNTIFVFCRAVNNVSVKNLIISFHFATAITTNIMRIMWQVSK